LGVWIHLSRIQIAVAAEAHRDREHADIIILSSIKHTFLSFFILKFIFSGPTSSSIWKKGMPAAAVADEKLASVPLAQDLSPLQHLRLAHACVLPPALAAGPSVVTETGGATAAVADTAEIERLFPATYGSREVRVQRRW
jgi:hypothetical protein